jgi:peroxiredoxin Q/BCP
MPYRALMGKTAPAITLLNYDGESYTFTPGEKGLPAALFFYPESGMYAELTIHHSPLLTCSPSKGLMGVQGRRVNSVMLLQVRIERPSNRSKYNDDYMLTTPSTEKDNFKPGQVQIIGISPDPVEKQKAFVEKEKLTV